MSGLKSTGEEDPWARMGRRDKVQHGSMETVGGVDWVLLQMGPVARLEIRINRSKEKWLDMVCGDLQGGLFPSSTNHVDEYEARRIVEPKWRGGTMV
jgi:hypothetical protein